MNRSTAPNYTRRKRITFLPVANDNFDESEMPHEQNELRLKELVAEAMVEFELRMQSMLMASQEAKSSPSNENLWDLDDVATYLNVAKKTVQNHLAPRPDFPAPLRFLGRSPRWNPNDIKRWAERSRGR
ncbi:helix-turn-helix transcriptional regulator [Gimibacter soli]|uniref:Helix-turn-helix domain-containing protein n=1 Tax=Gimibacter soli TaxID=3024400 RepID=A0AAE9XQZ0_9PROT|nr:hypothetical protein [Gimibacter soli]WCL53496.1 hypothetical protein PH603_13205 [Gimibacter soli]